jgi:site-specific DNA-methyltransferase (adenine-specific)
MDCERFLNDCVALYAADCREVLATLPENSVDACVTDPPYELAFMGRAWDQQGVAFNLDTWRAVYRVLKPGAHLLAFGGTRTYHRMVCAIEDAGFEIRDCIQWIYGTGFPKSRDISKDIDRAAGAEREIIGEKRAGLARKARNGGEMCGGEESFEHLRRAPIELPATDAAREWAGFGTALKPACEPIVLARKPLSEGTIAANVLKWGTGALNIDGCRIGIDISDNIHAKNPHTFGTIGENGIYGKGNRTIYEVPTGRWPANVIHNGSEEVLAAFPETESGIKLGGQYARETGVHVGGQRVDGTACFGDSGSAARFFYTSKADVDDRLGSRHPTVKPLDLMQYLIRLVTPKGGTVLDCFAGTGTTGEAAWREGMQAVLIEREAEYCADIRKRMGLALASQTERRVAGVKQAPDYGPLFGGKT